MTRKPPSLVFTPADMCHYLTELEQTDVAGLHATLRPDTTQSGVRRLRLDVAGFRRQTVVGAPARLSSTIYLPTTRYTSLEQAIYNEAMRLAAQALPEDYGTGRYTDLFPGWKPTK